MRQISMTVLVITLLALCGDGLLNSRAMAQAKRKAPRTNSLAAKYKAVQSELGKRSGAEVRGPGGGRFQIYENGGIYWSRRTGAHAVSGAVFRKYTEMGGVTGALGYPVTDGNGTDKDGKQVVFQHGIVTLNQAGEPKVVTTAWATFNSHGVRVIAGVKTKRKSVHSALLLPPESGPITYTCACTEADSKGTCRLSIFGSTVTCTKGSCHKGCAIGIAPTGSNQ